MRAMTQGWFATIACVAVAIATGCGAEPAETPVPEAERPTTFTLTLAHSSIEGAAGPVLITLDAGLFSPDDIPAAGLRWPRLEPPDGTPWPEGWKVLPREPPFGGAKGGIPADRRIAWPIEIVRTKPGSAVSAELVLSLEYTQTAGGPPVHATSTPVRVEFPADAAPHPVGKRDVQGAAGGDVFLRVVEAQYDAPSTLVEVRPGGAWGARPAGDAATAGVLSDDQQSALRDALERSRVWELLGRENDRTPRDGETWISVVLVLGDAVSVLQVSRSTIEGVAGWPELSKTLAELTGVEIPAR